jgi:hypothetical protein
MSAQLPLPAAWALNLSPLDAHQRLENLQRDKAEARGRIRDVLDWLVERHRGDTMVPRATITRAVGDAVSGYGDDMISDATYEIESALMREIEDDTDWLEKRGLL